MSEPDDRPPGPPGRALREDGTLEGERPKEKVPAPIPPKTPPPPSPLANSASHRFGAEPHLEALTTGDLELVPSKRMLVEPPLPSGQRAISKAAPSKRGPLITILVLIVLALGALAVVRRFPSVARQLPSLPVHHEQVLIMSEPSGATIRVGDSELGTTPWAGDNLWTGKVPVILVLEGHQPWTGFFQGGQAQTINATLKKAP